MAAKAKNTKTPTGNGENGTADVARTPRKPAQRRTDFFDGALDGVKIRSILEQHAPQLLAVFPVAYEELSNRKRAPWNSLEAVEARAAELRARRALLDNLAAHQQAGDLSDPLDTVSEYLPS